ncbi:MAG: chalcone isomerase family protein [Kofleriaceae bacterium]|nr:chalcone isomerase family protein [Kofleriaceae bacterium]
MRLASLLIVLSTMLPMQAVAGSKAGVTMPDKITVAGKPLVLNGMGLREATALKIDVYVAGLYVQTPSSNPAQLINADETKVLMLTFVRDVDKGDITKAWTQGFKSNANVSAAQLDQLNSWMPDMKKGQTIKFTYVPGTGTIVDVAGQRKGTIQGADFSRSLLAVWLGDNPPSGALRKGLLGNH